MQLPELLQGPRIRYLAWLIVNGSAQAAIVIAMALMMQNAFDSLISTGSGPGDGALISDRRARMRARPASSFILKLT